ncbi:Cro/Cl family transcriptional regulator [Acinetobacter baumannii]|nr:Cro/Cl family transcriptional regulator [Acinetobacter baumannii]
MSQSSSVLQHVGTNIRSLRDERSLSQQDLADRAGVSRRTIAALETGQVNISLAKLDAIAAVLGVDFRTIVSAPELKEHALVNALAWQGEKEESKATFLASVPSRSQVELWTWSLAVWESYVAEADAEGWQELIYVLEGELTIQFTDSSKRLKETLATKSKVNERIWYKNKSYEMVVFVFYVSVFVVPTTQLAIPLRN